MAKILLVEDNELNRDMLSRRLTRRGYTVVVAEDGEQEFKHAQADSCAHMDHGYCQTVEKGHGRIEKRQYWYTRGYETGDINQCDTFRELGLTI